MTKDQLKETISRIEPTAVLTDTPQYLNVSVPKEQLFDFARKLKDTPELKFDYLFNLTGIDRQPNLEVVYHLDSSEFRHGIVLHTETADRENPEIDSVCRIWKTAEFHEREVYDLLGINFKNHPDLRRIFLDEDWKGYPLRKDYTDDRIIQR